LSRIQRIQLPRDFCLTHILKSIFFSGNRAPIRRTTEFFDGSFSSAIEGCSTEKSVEKVRTAHQAAAESVVQESGRTAKTMDWNKTNGAAVAGEKKAGFDVHTIS
jgi:hypothetical protein